VRRTAEAGWPERRRPLAATVAAGLASLSLFAAGCEGGSPSGGVAHVGSTTTTTSESVSADPMTQAIKYASCMRTHGVTDFPDPRTRGTGSVALSIPDSPAATAAMKACRQLLSGGGAPSASEQARRLASLLKYAACMREHGVPSFPDPDDQGEFPDSAGFDRSSPSYRAAQKGCLPLAGGFVKERR
jgi:hypothetical protein